MSNLHYFLKVHYFGLAYSAEINRYIYTKFSKYSFSSTGVVSLLCAVYLVEDAHHDLIYKLEFRAEADKFGFVLREKGPDPYMLVDRLYDRFEKKMSLFLDGDIPGGGTVGEMITPYLAMREQPSVVRVYAW